MNKQREPLRPLSIQLHESIVHELDQRKGRMSRGAYLEALLVQFWDDRKPLIRGGAV